MSLITWAFDWFAKRHTIVEVRVHHAYLTTGSTSVSAAHSVTATGPLSTTPGSTGWSTTTPAYFVNVLNASPERSVTVTHVWLDIDGTEAGRIPVLARKPPPNLGSDEEWETWLDESEVPAGLDHVEERFVVRLSTGAEISSQLREGVPPVGHVPG